MLHRFGRDRPTPNLATAGDVFLALSRDARMVDLLGEVHRKLFEGQGVRQGTSPDHFVYVSPGKARAEIDEVSAWVAERFGEPASTVPARTPFGYLSGRRDGWVTYFSALVAARDQALAVDFAESVAPMSWASAVTSRSGAVTSGGSSPPQAAASGSVPGSASGGLPPQYSASGGPAAAYAPTTVAPSESWFTRPFPAPAPPASTSAASPTVRGRVRGSVPESEPAREGWVDRFMGIPAPSPARERALSLVEEDLTDEEIGAARELLRRERAGDVSLLGNLSPMAELEYQREVARRRVRDMEEAPPPEVAFPASARAQAPERLAREEDDVEVARARALAARAREEAIRQHEEGRAVAAEAAEVEKISEVAKLRRPKGGPAGSFGG